MALIQFARMTALKAKVKAEMQRRNATGSVAAYAGTAYDYSDTSGKIVKEHYTKNIDPLRAVDTTNVPTAGGDRAISENDIAQMEAKITVLSAINKEVQSGHGCRSSCTGLCSTACTGGCRGCSGCSGCSAACKTNCSGCDGCSGCGTKCSSCTSCDGCSGCGSACRNDCTSCTSCSGCSGCSGCTSCEGGSCTGSCWVSCASTCEARCSFTSTP